MHENLLRTMKKSNKSPPVFTIEYCLWRTDNRVYINVKIVL